MTKNEDAAAGAEDVSAGNLLKVWTDDPAKKIADDEFDMERFARALAERIDACRVGQGSVVFGLVGRWGSGKSSVLGMLREILKDNDWEVAVFSPWAAPDTRGLEFEFHAALGHAMAPDGTGAAKPLVDALKKYARAAVPIAKLLPVAGEALEGVIKEIIDASLDAKPWQVLHDELARILSSQKRRVLVIADDIDRLDSSELLAFLKIVRLVGRLPNVHHLIAYDGAMVEDLLLQQGFVGGGASYIEKIVQHPFVLPPLSDVTRFREAEKTVTAVLQKYSIKLDEADALRARALVSILAQLLETPREHLRFREYVLAEARLISHLEVDVLDLIGVSYLRSDQRRVYARLMEWTTPDEVRAWTRSSSVDEENSGTDYLAELLLITSPGRAEPVLELLSFLLPHIGASFTNGHQDHAKAFSDTTYRHRYLLLGVPMDDYADARLEKAIDDLAGDDIGSPAALELAETLDSADSADSARTEVAMGKLLAARRGSVSTSNGLIDFALTRLELRTGARRESGFGEGNVWMLAAWEVARGFPQGLCTPGGLEERLGRQTTMQLLRAVRRFCMPRDGGEVKALIDSSNHYRERVAADPGEFLSDEGGLRFTLDMISTVLGLESVTGILDDYVGDDAKRFARVADAFSIEKRFTDGQEWTVEWAFARELFASALSPAARERHAELFSKVDAASVPPVDPDDETAVARRSTAQAGVASLYNRD